MLAHSRPLFPEAETGHEIRMERGLVYSVVKRLCGIQLNLKIARNKIRRRVFLRSYGGYGMNEDSMKTVSNVMPGVGIAIVIGSFALNAAGLTHIAMSDALMAGGFCKGIFLPVDASV